MTHQTRALAALNLRPVDRIPRYICAIACEVSSRILGRPVHTGTGSLHYAETVALLRGEQAHREFVEKLFEDLAELYRALDIDVYRIPWRQTAKPTRQIDDYTFLFGRPEGDHTICQYSPESGDFGPINIVRKQDISPEEQLRRFLDSAEKEAGHRMAAIKLDKDYKTVFEKYGREFFMVYNGGGIGTGMTEDDLMMIVTEPELMRRKVMLQAESGRALGRALARSQCPRVLLGGGDLAGNEGPLYSPESFRQIMLPALRHMMAGFKAGDIHYVFRSDGNLWPIADMLFNEAGCQGFGEADRVCGMTVKALRERYPGLVIWGNFSSDQLLRQSAAWVREESQRILAESGGTGYFHGASNAILKGTSVENVLALFGMLL